MKKQQNKMTKGRAIKWLDVAINGAIEDGREAMANKLIDIQVWLKGGKK